MRIKAIQLSWFRGAADSVSLEPDCKSMVVYGVNGSGKSSFVDAVEYVLNEGRIGHLAHEYSGERQERAISNTHKPQGRNVKLTIAFKDDSQLKTEITAGFSSTSSGAEAVAMHRWDYRRTVLRQDEVAAFIHHATGRKYSALLPLLGLHQMEVAAENLRQLAKSVEEQSQLRESKGELKAIEEGRGMIAITEQVDMVSRAEALISFIISLEQGIREEITLCSQSVIDEISTSIRTMWNILHPGEPLEGVCLSFPQNTEQTIDIDVSFCGVDRKSPRLTLSESYRSSLGLCIFLAMAKRETDKDRPVFLDDVVVSLDRNHRGMIVELLEKEFSGRQVIILTHDRDWYTELRQQLDRKNWVFKALLPYETPELGIRWSHKTTTFDDARAHLNERPDSAGNDVRKIMDVEFALLAERLQIRLPYLRGDKNDMRTAHDFLSRFVADGKKCFKRKGEDGYEVYTDAIDALDHADRLLNSWANRASHTFDVVRSEASKLIDDCEKALAFFKCPLCRKGVWFADAHGSAWVQCKCGQIRWLYGKG